MTTLNKVLCAVLGIAFLAVGSVSLGDTPGGDPADSAVRIEVRKGGERLGHGSGVYIGDGLILTAAHVVDEEGSDIKVIGEGAEGTAAVLWANKDYDVALLRTSDFIAPAARLSCRALKIGETVKAVGNPGPLSFIHTYGRVAGKTETRRGTPTAIVDLVISPGMSGGPLFDQQGRVVGIAHAVAVTVLGGMYPSIVSLGYIIPGSAICELMGRK